MLNQMKKNENIIIKKKKKKKLLKFTFVAGPSYAGLGQQAKSPKSSPSKCPRGLLYMANVPLRYFSLFKINRDTWGGMKAIRERDATLYKCVNSSIIFYYHGCQFSLRMVLIYPNQFRRIDLFFYIYFIL